MASTLNMTQSILDIAALLSEDRRVQIYFTVPPHPFNPGAAGMLAACGAPLLPWEQARSEHFDLAVTAGMGNFDQVDAPVALFKHGASRNKRARPRGRGSIPVTGPVTGFSRPELIHSGMLVPSLMALAHDRELSLLEEGCPEALAVAAVVGDPNYDRITKTMAQRQRYRDALGLTAGQKLVVATSTWRDGSLFGSAPHILERVARELPRPGYATAVLTHPNIWAAHGSYQVRAWLAGCTRHGMTVVPPEVDWQPIVMAADYIIGDHGSVTLYGAAVGIPVLLGAFPAAEVHPESGAAVLGAHMPRITANIPLDEQLQRADREFDPAAVAQAAATISSQPGSFARHTRRLLYSLLRLEEPTYTARLPTPSAPPSLADMRNPRARLSSAPGSDEDTPSADLVMTPDRARLDAWRP
jgi:hypothetical protein